MFLRNAWYVAGWSSDVGRDLKAEMILGDRIVFFRKTDGSPVALENACPHRKLPLSQGQLKGDAVECGYHGLTFDSAGSCVAAPTQRDAVPRRARVHSYPVVDRYRLLWIWMGDPDKADPDEIFEIENFDNPDWALTDGGAMDLACNFLWMCDNLLDPSHVAWVHVTSFGGGGTEDAPLDVATTDSGVVVSRWILDQAPSPYYADLVAFEGNCDRLQHYEMCVPGIGLNKSVYTPAGSGGPDSTASTGTFVNISYNFMTPVDADNTRYFWFQHRNGRLHDTDVSRRMNEGAKMAFEEDRVVLEEVHKGMKASKTPHIDLGLDAGAKHFRRKLAALIAKENLADAPTET